MQRICVFCGSRPGARPEYMAAAVALGRLMAERGIGLVYGGASVGTMGAIADAALAAGGEVIGVIPDTLVAREVAHDGLSRLHVVNSMHARKALMASLSDAFISLPGGTGTLDELFEAFTWAQLGLHRKPMALVNVCGYYAPLLAFLDHAVEQRFLTSEHRMLIRVADDPESVLAALLTA